MISRDPMVLALKALASERERAEIRVHPIGCPERRSLIQQAELESFQPRTPPSCGLWAMGNARAARARVGQAMEEVLQDRRGRILFGLNMSVAHSTVSDVVYVAAGREVGFSRSFS